ncbi:GTP-binding protein [Clostridium ljungdahlii]|uniref:CobW C-terminal domain-containing protein n=1 Tax=Clostridium ljungdahlii TaxID=1538 RepID=A0A166QZA5_9CLOT|nr:GTP-binding protein [Clostridium ljungdahlii]OAA90514.1 hypothetical protein WY13_01418 [Clostridium ljungdahlii]
MQQQWLRRLEDIEVSEKDTRKSLFKKPNVVKMLSSKMKFKIKRKISTQDVFESFGIETPKIFSVETLKSIFENLKDENLYGKILRAKGILQTDKDHWIEFDFAAKEFEIRDTRSDYAGRICVIGVNLNKKNLTNLF